MIQKKPATLQSVKSAFETIAQDWNRLREKPWPVIIDFLEKYNGLKLYTNEYLLDLGCGNGRHTVLFSDKVGHAIGVDFSLNLLRIANNKRNILHINNISYLMADISSLPFKNEIFSNIILLATLHHIPNRVNRLSSLNEMKRILKISGTCLITVWRRWQKRFFWHFCKEIFYYIIKFKSLRDFGDIFIPWTRQDGEIIPRFYHLFTQHEMKNLIQKTKFQIILLKNLGGATQRENIFATLKKVS